MSYLFTLSLVMRSDAFVDCCERRRLLNHHRPPRLASCIDFAAIIFSFCYHRMQTSFKLFVTLVAEQIHYETCTYVPDFFPNGDFFGSQFVITYAASCFEKLIDLFLPDKRCQRKKYFRINLKNIALNSTGISTIYWIILIRICRFFYLWVAYRSILLKFSMH